MLFYEEKTTLGGKINIIINMLLKQYKITNNIQFKRIKPKNKLKCSLCAWNFKCIDFVFMECNKVSCSNVGAENYFYVISP